MTKTKPSIHCDRRRGYIEGYYGRMLSWPDRRRILDQLAQLGMSDYFYAPKEDPNHRFNWRQAYDADWRQACQDFTKAARARGINVSVGIAPGLDFDFSGFDALSGDYAILKQKAEALLEAGAHHIGLLLDDLDPGFPGHAGGFDHEGEAHTALANRLAADLDAPVHLTPRLYADEIEGDGQYLEHMAAHLDRSINVFTCGSHIVAPDTGLADTKIVHAGIPAERLMIWDNLYANDYCPRRLYLGVYSGRHDDQDILLNPTGMAETDCLLLAIMAAGDDAQGWRQALLAHGVPESFFQFAPAFWLPPKPDGRDENSTMPQPLLDVLASPQALDDLDHLLWRWKSPLQREWYPFLMGLRHDILLNRRMMPEDRVAKTMPPLLTPHVAHLKTPKDDE